MALGIKDFPNVRFVLLLYADTVFPVVSSKPISLIFQHFHPSDPQLQSNYNLFFRYWIQEGVRGKAYIPCSAAAGWNPQESEILRCHRRRRRRPCWAQEWANRTEQSQGGVQPNLLLRINRRPGDFFSLVAVIFMYWFVFIPWVAPASSVSENTFVKPQCLTEVWESKVQPLWGNTLEDRTSFILMMSMRQCHRVLSTDVTDVSR